MEADGVRVDGGVFGAGGGESSPSPVVIFIVISIPSVVERGKIKHFRQLLSANRGGDIRWVCGKKKDGNWLRLCFAGVAYNALIATSPKA